MIQKVDISTASLLRLILLLLGIWFIYLIRDVLILLFLVVIIVAGVTPLTDKWSRYLSRPGAVVAIFLLFFIILTGIASLLIPPLVIQIREFSTTLPETVKTFSQSSNTGFIDQVAALMVKNLDAVSSQLGDIGGTIFTKTVGVISGVVAVLTIFVLTFYLLIDEHGIKKLYKGLLPPGSYEGLAETTKKIALKLGSWLRGQLLLMLAVGSFVTIGLSIIGMPYALTLGVWAGITEVVPMVGPWIGAVPGVIVGLTISPLHGFLALIVYTVVQQLENNFLVPKIMSKAVGLNPVIVIIAILIGGKLYGILGVLLAVPLAAVIGVLAEDWTQIRTTLSSPKK